MAYKRPWEDKSDTERNIARPLLEPKKRGRDWRKDRLCLRQQYQSWGILVELEPA